MAPGDLLGLHLDSAHLGRWGEGGFWAQARGYLWAWCQAGFLFFVGPLESSCLLYTSDAADDVSWV